MKALLKASEIRSAARDWQKAFREDAEVVATMGGEDVLWHERLRIWGLFSETKGRKGSTRAWNAFGQKPAAFRSNIVVEINPPSSGVDDNLQGIYAIDDNGARWILHQGRMSVVGARVTEADFIQATGLKPISVDFGDGSSGLYHRVAPLDAPAAVAQDAVAAFVARCASARLAKSAPGAVTKELARVQDWERGLSPEALGTFDIAARKTGSGRRWHAEVMRALSSELTKRSVKHSNDRVSRYGPDLFTFGAGPRVLFEIKSAPSARDVFEAVGQLHVYDRLLGANYRKVLVIPIGVTATLSSTLQDLGIVVVAYERKSRTISFDTKKLAACLKP